MNKSEKINVLKKLMNKSVREGQKELLKLSPDSPLPLETKKQVTPTHTYVGFSMSEELEIKLEDIKSLLGSKAYDLSMSDLINQMADLAKEKLQEKKFGKKMAAQIQGPASCLLIKKKSKYKEEEAAAAEKEESINAIKEVKESTLNLQSRILEYPPLDVQTKLIKKPDSDDLNHYRQTKAQFINEDQGQTEIIENAPSRYISKKLKYKIWQKNNIKCCHCSTHFNLQVDHVKPYSFGGKTSEENLSLLCFNCNQRKRIEDGL